MKYILETALELIKFDKYGKMTEDFVGDLSQVLKYKLKYLSVYLCSLDYDEDNARFNATAFFYRSMKHGICLGPVL